MQQSYDILGVNKNDNEATIKKAYKTLAMKYHPDKGGDEAKFKEISNAYEDICNPKHTPPIHNNWTTQPAPSSKFNRKGSQTYILKISLMDAVHGCDKKLSLTENDSCNDCIATCGTCNGSGLVEHILQMPSFMQKMTRTCESCRGKGNRIMRTTCSTCNNTHVIEKTQIVQVKVPSGVNHGDKRSVLTPNNDQLIIVFHIIPESSGLKKIGCNLLFTKNINFLDSFLGLNIELPHPHGNIQFSLNEIIIPGKQYIAKKNYGSPIFPGSKNPQKGDYLVEFSINYNNIKHPHQLDDNIKYFIRNALTLNP